MANSSGGRKCPKCGMNLGQKNLCPICDKPAQNNANAGGNAASASSQGGDYVSSVIEFVENHPFDWDDEFNTFYEQQGRNHSRGFKECYEACSRIHDILAAGLPESGRISGSLTLKTMTIIQEVFPEIPEDRAQEIAVALLKRNMKQPSAPVAGGASGASATPANAAPAAGIPAGLFVAPGASIPEQVNQYFQLRNELVTVRDDFLAVMRKMKDLLKYADIFFSEYDKFYMDMYLNEQCPLAIYSLFMLRPWRQVICELKKTPLNLTVIDPPNVYMNGKNRTDFFRRFAKKHQVSPDERGGIGTSWKELEPRGTEVLILYCGKGIDIRNASNPTYHLTIVASAKALDLLDGLQYRRKKDAGDNLADYFLLYMTNPEQNDWK